MGAYVSDRPLGPFVYQSHNPISGRRDGLVRGPGHGCIVVGPRGTLWAFYTCTVRVKHLFERRIGMDPAGIDADGNLFVQSASAVPQFMPGHLPHPEAGNEAGLLPFNHARAVAASSFAPGRTPDYAVDDYMRTWWQPAQGDREPWLVSSWPSTCEAAAVRLLWTEEGLDYDAGRGPGPVRYIVETSADETGDAWQVAVDACANAEDLLIDYRTFAPRPARRARLRIVGVPPGLTIGVTDFSLFGR